MKLLITSKPGIVLVLAATLAWPSARVVAGGQDADVTKRIAELEEQLRAANAA